MQPDLEILSAMIQAHARELAAKEWEQEHKQLLMQIFENAVLATSKSIVPGARPEGTLSLDGREVPTEVIVKAIRKRFIEVRTKTLIQKLTVRIVADAGRKVLDEEDASQENE
jgi:hypothetical protein